MEEHFADAIGVEEMAAVAGVSVRSVQATFRRLRGCSPMEALTRLRLERARRMLNSAGPETRVTGVATECGFFHFGRFARQYRQLFGEPPSATLLRAAGERSPGPGARVLIAQLGIPFTDLSGLVRPGSADDLAIWRWSDSDRLLGEPVEKQSAGL